MAQLWLLVPIVGVSTAWLYILTLFAPTIDDSARAQLSFPSTLEELRALATALKLYSVNHAWYVFLIYGSAYIYKQAFCIPGSLFLNMLSGALYGRIGGLFFACLLTATGASMCYLLSKTFAKELVIQYFPKQVESFATRVHKNEDRLIFLMLFLRLVPVTPGWVVNLVSPLVNIPLGIFYITAFIGLGPYNFVGVSAGSMVSTLKSVNDVFTWTTFMNIALIALFALGPALIFKTTFTGKTLASK